MLPEFPYQRFNKDQIIRKINLFYRDCEPFLFVVDYTGSNGYVIAEKDLDANFIQFNFNGKGNEKLPADNKTCNIQLEWEIQPVSFESYRQAFQYVTDQIHRGNSFLTNLTQPTPVKTNLSTPEIFHQASSRYKLWIKNHFLVLSPEIFVQIDDDSISSFPMKGTIDASLPDAEFQILNDLKEKAEHATIVDLIRNDLSMVADDVFVARYRYVEKIVTNRGDILQVSSEIKGRISEYYRNNPGELLFALLPAGSVTGAPKPQTLRIIEHAEGYNRGFYTGICGYFDGKKIDSAVMIRFLEESPEGLIFKSGGGITSQSDLNKEYAELIQKVYVPVS